MGEENVDSYFSGRSNEEIFSGFLHEIRGPLASVMGYLTMLNLLELPEENGSRKFVESALRGAQYIANSTDQALRYIEQQRDDL